MTLTEFRELIKNIAPLLSVGSLIISCISCIVAFLNVPRAKKASLKNDEERFKRDLNLKTSDQFIEALFDLSFVVQGCRSFNSSGNPLELNESIWKFEANYFLKISQLKLLCKKRMIILEKYNADIIRIQNMSDEISSLLYDLKSKYNIVTNESTEDMQNIRNDIQPIQKNAELLINEIDLLIKKVQEDFINPLYR